MNEFQRVDPIWVIKRDGSSQNPYRSYEETWQVAQSKVILNEVPDELTRVCVKDKSGNNLYETKSRLPKENEFYVDYQYGYVFFNSVNEGKKFIFAYKGRGVIKIPYSRIYFEKNSEQETIQTLGEISQNAYNNARYAEEQADRVQYVADNTKYVEPYNSTKQYYKNNIVNHNGNSYMAKQDTLGNEPTGFAEDEYWGLVGYKGQDGVGSVSIHQAMFTATEGQTVFTLPFTYEPLQNKTRVYIGGVPQNTPENYEETNENTITLLEGAPEGIEVYIEVFSTEFDDRIPEFDAKMSDIDTAINNANEATNNANTAANSINVAINNANLAIQSANEATINANNATNKANEAADKANEAADNTNIVIDNANQAIGNVNYAINYANQTVDSLQTEWKNPVATFSELSTTYPIPANGWTVQVYNDTDTVKNGIYRYNESQTSWQKTQVYNDTVTVGIQGELLNIKRSEMIPSLTPIEIEGMTLGNFYIPKNPVILGNVTLG